MDYQAPLQVPMSSPDLTEAERQAVLDVVSTNYLSMGPKIREFENAMKEFIGVKYALAVSSGTTGLHLCIRAADVEMNDFVITTPFSFVSSANVILFEKAIPIFVDIDEKTGNIDTNLVAQAAEDLATGGQAARKWLPRKINGNSGKLKAILSVDVFGQPADLDPLQSTARKHNIRLIDDSCEALGAEYKDRKIGSIGDFSVFAFYPNKQITTGEGGIIVTDDDEAASLMNSLRNQGRAPHDTWLTHTYLGYNYRLNEMSCALGAVQMRRINELIDNRTRVAEWYNRALQEIEGIEIPYVHPNTTRNSWFVYVIRLESGRDTGKIAEKLKERGVPVRPYFSPIHLQPYMRDMFGYQPGDFPITENLGQRGLALPFSGVMQKEQVDHVCQVLKETL